MPNLRSAPLITQALPVMLGRWMLTLLLSLWAAMAMAQPVQQASDGERGYIVQSAFWTDPSAQASFENAQQQTYTPYNPPFSRGYSDGANWIRLTLAPSAQPLALRIGPNWLDHITVFDPANAQLPFTAGDRHPADPRALTGLGYAFALPASPSERNIWLRLQTTSTHLLSAQVMPLSESAAASTRQIIWSALYSSVFVLIFMLLLVVWWGQRDRVLGAYLVRHGAYTLYGAFYLGLPTLLWSDVFSPLFFDQAFSLSVTVMVLLGVPFDIVFLSQYQPRKYLLTLLKSTVLFSAAVVVVWMLGHTRLALYLNSLVLMVAVIVMLLTALSCRPTRTTEQVMPKKIMVVYYLLIFSSLLIGLLNTQGWFQVRAWTLYALILHGLISAVMMTTMLLVRAHRQTQQSQHMRWELQKTQQDMELEQRRRHEQTQFLHMLMHELKTPLSIVSLALGTRGNREENLNHASRAVQDMKAIIDRCVQADQLGELTLTPLRQNIQVEQLVLEQCDNIPGLPARLRLHSAPHLHPLHTDPQLLQIIVTNLLHNAARYSDPHTPIDATLELATQQGQEGLALSVGNTPGLAGWPDPEQLFQKYYRATGAQRESGSGLGLYLSKQLAHTLGGTLRYAPSAQQVKFTLWIPLHPA